MQSTGRVLGLLAVSALGNASISSKTIFSYDCVYSLCFSDCQDIYQIDPHHPGRLEQLFSEWRIKRKKWQERKAVRRRLTELESTEDSDTDKPIRDFIVNWWETIRNAQKTSPKLIQETTKKAVDDWWSQVTSSFRRTRRSFEEDISDIKEIVQSDTTKDGAEATVEEDENTLVKKGNPFRRDFLDPVAACQFDIAVVLMGLNDIKDAFMPHMTAGRASSLEEGTVKIQGGLRRQLQEVLSALDTKMDLGGEEKDNSSTSDNGSLRNLRRPLVVVPELPVAPLSLFRTAPLCWFLVPIFRAMENNKRFLSSCFPEYVVFIPQPNLQWWSDVEAGLGPIRENARKERLLLRMTDIAQTARERIQGLMKEHYGAEDDDDTEMGSFDERPSDAEELQDLVDLEYSSKVERRKKGTKQQSPFIAADKMHPNDEGYEIWGRHIADAIIEHWNRE